MDEVGRKELEELGWLFHCRAIGVPHMHKDKGSLSNSVRPVAIGQGVMVLN